MISKRTLFLFLAVLPLLASAQDSKENADFKLAVNLYNDKLYDLALEQFRQFINLYPNTAQGVDARFYLGLTQQNLGKYEDARFTFQNFALAYPDHPRAAEAWMNVAASYVAMKSYRDAALAYERVKTFQPKSKFAASALLKAADEYEQSADTADAKRVLRMLTQEYSTPEVLNGRLKLAALLLAGGEDESARQECRRVLDGTKDPAMQSRGLYLMATALLRLNQIQDAEQALAQVVKDYPSSDVAPSAMVMLGSIRYDLGNTDEAMASWRAVADDSVRSPMQIRQDAYFAMGDANARVNQYARALALYEKAASIGGKKSGEALFDAGLAAENLRDTVRAARLYQRALEDTTGSADSRAALIAAFRGARWLRNTADALRSADEYLRRFPADPLTPRVLLESGWTALNDAADAPTAAARFDAVLRDYPRSAFVDDALYARSQADRRMGDPGAALDRLERLLRQYPASTFADRATRDIASIRAFEMANRQTGLEKLALLIGDVIAGKSRGSLAYRLAEISYHDLNDYTLAADQYAMALSADLDENDRPTAWLFRGRALELAAQRATGRTAETLRSSALDAFDSLGLLYPSSTNAAAARSASALLRLSSGATPEVAQSIADSVSRTPAAFDDPALLLLQIGDRLRQSGRVEAAVGSYRTALRLQPGIDVSAGATYGVALCVMQQGSADSARTLLEQCARDYPDTRHAADVLQLLAADARDSGDVGAADRELDLLTQRYFYAIDPGTVTVDRAAVREHAGAYADAAALYRKALDDLRADYFDPVHAAEETERLLFHLATCADKSGDGADARRWYAEYVSRDQASPSAARAYYALATLARADNAIGLAEEYLRNAGRISAATGTSVGNVTLETAELLFENEKYTEARTKYDEVARQAASDSLRRYAEARSIVCAYRSDAITDADKRANQFVRAYPKAYDEAAEFEYERGRFALRKEDVPRAQERFRNVAASYRKAPILPEALYWLGRSYELDQKFPLAVRLYDSLLTVFPGNAIVPRVRLALGNAYYTLEQWDSASVQFRAILDHEDRSPDLVMYAMNNLIMTYKEMQMYDAALQLTRTYIERFPSEPDLMDKRVDIGILYDRLGYYDQAIVHLQSLLDSAPPSLEAELRYYIGEAHYYKGEYQQAILEFLKVPYLVTNPGKIDWISTSYYMAGQSYEKMSKYDQAILMYKQIIDRKDTDTQFKVAAQKQIDRVRSLIGKSE